MMNLKRAIAALCLCLLAVSSARAEAGLTYVVELQAPEALREMFEAHLDLYRWRGNERLDEDQLRRLVRAAPQQIGEFLATQGYYAPTIGATLERRDAQWVVKLSIDAGEPVRVTAFEVKLVGPIEADPADAQSRLGEIRAQWSLRPGARFRHDDWENAKRGALKTLLLARYPAATIADSQATVDPAGNSVALTTTLHSGPPFTFGELEIRGLQRYPASLVHAVNPITPGAHYAQALLLELQSRLQDSPYFSAASVTAATDPAQPERVPVRIEVTEQASRKVDFGIGASTDTGPRAQIGYRDLDFHDRAWRLSGKLQVEAKRQSIGGELQFPAGPAGYSDSLDTLLERADIEGEVTRKAAVGAKRGRVRGKDETVFGVRYLVELQNIAGTAGERRAALVPSWSWTRRDVDSLLYPTRGWVFNVQADVAAKALLSDRSFLRGATRATWFLPMSARDQWILRGEVGAVAASQRQGIPSDYLFRTGGDRTVRGYAFQSLGVAEQGAIVGGRYLAVASAEYQHWFTPQWGGAAFVDSGDAADAVRSLYPVLGYGLGARWKSPVGPLHLDIAYGREVRAVRLHLSVGLSF